ncbi:MAG: tRNA preQ1(34) S-adenosylmethionine ribosyltransferase-isomerase QueA [Planctomycetes bacterium]|nr:tRNA preQ1(34) S-adenosylmethionine ribosyltransferase-isomerase QueA [Planctomycetota bacterium]
MSQLDQYDYELPPHLIAQSPPPNRVDARLLVVDRATGEISHQHVRDLPEILRKNDGLVLNDTQVLPARLVGLRTETGGRWEGLFLEATAEGLWRLLGKTRGKLTPGETVTLTNAEGKPDIRLHLGAKEPEGIWVARPESDEETFTLLNRVGRVPLPPYIRDGEMVSSDRQRYQTVYASRPGSVAAPTAGLHFTERLLRQLHGMGVTLSRLTLHVGMGTFRPISAGSLDEHRMHSEWVQIGPDAVERIENCRRQGGRIVAVGTTSVRTLETAAANGSLQPFTGQTDLFIRPPFQFHAVDAMLTNFHLPRSTLLVLVRTFGGDELITRAYSEAICQQYRFYSYGDAMLIL